MPGGDRTGPAGQGPRTGRGAGLCSGNSAPGFMNRIFGGRFGRGLRTGGGVQPRAFNRVTPGKNTLDQLRSLREQLNEIEKEIKGTRDD